MRFFLFICFTVQTSMLNQKTDNPDNYGVDHRDLNLYTHVKINPKTGHGKIWDKTYNQYKG